jgi:hypothetical protein
MRHAYFRHLTVRRKSALVFAAVWLAAFGVLFVPAALRIPPAQWSPYYTLAAGLYNAAALAVMLVEILRVARPQLDIHSDAIHFRWVGLLTVFLLALAATGYLFTIDPQP